VRKLKFARINHINLPYFDTLTNVDKEWIVEQEKQFKEFFGTTRLPDEAIELLQGPRKSEKTK